MSKPGGTTARGYGSEHQRMRLKWKPLVEAGQVHCWRCQQWLEPGKPWDLGHADEDRSVYRGPECVPCNRATKGRRKRSVLNRWAI